MEKIKSLFISDIHLGTKKSQPEKLLEVFKLYEFDNLFILGDFIDLTSLKRKFYWNEKMSTVIQKILKMSRKGKVKIVYCIGNHEYYLRGLIEEQNISIGDIEMCNEYIYKTLKGESIYMCHGDAFDGFVRLHPLLYLIGDLAYEFSFKISSVYNKIRHLFGFNNWSLSQFLKNNVKNAISYINDFKYICIKKLEDVNCDSVMIGHIHSAVIEKIENHTYYNTGDFCESCEFLIENLDGEIIKKNI